MKSKALFTLILFMLTTAFFLKASESFGTIQGKVSEESGNRAIPGVRIEIMDTEHHTVSNEKGEFKFVQVPVGHYSLKLSAPGFRTIIETDVMVRSERITFVNVSLQAQLPQLEESITVTESYFRKDDKAATSKVNISSREMRRTPGTAGLVSRMLTALPGVTAREDVNTDLIVRGGSPMENGFYLDNIEVPNINHLPRLGSCGGAYSAINPDLVQDLDFYAGGFSANFGDRLSSITDISLREGNLKEFDGQIDINAAMAGIVLEGPLQTDKGSWLISARKSYFEVLNEVGLLEVANNLNTQDMQAKLTYNLSPRHKLNLLNFTTNGSFQDYYGRTTEKNAYTQNSLGINWKSLWSEKFFSNTSLSFSLLKRRDKESYPIETSDFYWEAADLRRFVSLRNLNFLVFDPFNKLEFGMQIKHERDDIDHYVHAYTYLGNYYPARTYDLDYHTNKYSLFATYIWKPLQRLTISMGIRGDYSSAQEVVHISPRYSLSYQISKRLALNGSFGVFYQTIPMRFLAYYPQHLELEDMRAAHYTLGFDYQMDSGTKITLEAYSKSYKNLLIDPRYPKQLASELAIDSYYFPYSLSNDGTGYSRGLELMVHQKLVKYLYGIFSAALFRSQYHDLHGIERSSEYDNRFIVNIMAGYKPSPNWEFSFRWNIIGGRPRTPYDLEKSQEFNYLWYDMNRYHSERYPVYNRLNLRVEKRFYFGRSNLAVYLDLWNALNHKNVYYYKWNSSERAVESEDMLSLVPILGIEFEF